jgi:hypothetical protein
VEWAADAKAAAEADRWLDEAAGAAMARHEAELRRAQPDGGVETYAAELTRFHAQMASLLTQGGAPASHVDLHAHAAVSGVKGTGGELAAGGDGAAVSDNGNSADGGQRFAGRSRRCCRHSPSVQPHNLCTHL